MERGLALRDHLLHLPDGAALAPVIEALAAGAAEIAAVLGSEPAVNLERELGQGAGGDAQKALDRRAHEVLRAALLHCGVAAFASEEGHGAEALDPAGVWCVAVDPIDGSGNIGANLPVGTVFSVLRAAGRENATTAWPPGTAQKAAGFFLYGPQTILVLATGETVDVFAQPRGSQDFRLMRAGVRLPEAPVHDYAINASNYRHWEEPVRAFVDECLAGTAGHYGSDFNMRWHGALVAEAYRILGRGGIYLYPSDARDGYAEGRLRLVYEAYPIAFLMERAGGAASTGRRRILDLEVQSLHQRVPLIFGTRAMVERLEGFHHRTSLWPPSEPPLFANRGLFRR